jgi:hypothetical protein
MSLYRDCFFTTGTNCLIDKTFNGYIELKIAVIISCAAFEGRASSNIIIIDFSRQLRYKLIWAYCECSVTKIEF